MNTQPLIRLDPPAAAPQGLQTLRSAGALSLCLTRHCNISCRHCSVEALDTRGIQRMPLDIATRAVDVLALPSGRRQFRIVFFGGEPLLMPVEWYQGLQAHLDSHPGMRFILGMQSNGTLLTEPILQMLESLGIELSISLDGPPALNDVLRENGSKVERNLRRLIEAGLDPRVLVVIAPHNAAHVAEILAYLRGLGVRKVRFNHLFPVGRAVDGSHLSDTQLLQARLALVDDVLAQQDDPEALRDVATCKLLEKFARHLEGLHAQPRGDCTGYTCHAGLSYFSVTPDGQVFPCSDMSFADWAQSLGRVQDGGFDPARMRRVLGLFHAKGPWWDRCRSCAAQVICDFGCPALTPEAARVGNPECEVTRAMWHALWQRRTDISVWYSAPKPSSPCAMTPPNSWLG
jgi:uncharacterized protein